MSSDVCQTVDCFQDAKMVHVERLFGDPIQNSPSIKEMEKEISEALQEALASVRLISSNVSRASSNADKPQPRPIGCLMDAMMAQCEDVASLNMELHRIIDALGCDR